MTTILLKSSGRSLECGVVAPFVLHVLLDPKFAFVSNGRPLERGLRRCVRTSAPLFLFCVVVRIIISEEEVLVDSRTNRAPGNASGRAYVGTIFLFGRVTATDDN